MTAAQISVVVPPKLLRLSTWGIFVRLYGKSRESKPWKQKPNRNARLSLILTEDLGNLGVKGQVVKVKHGFGRNYLLPGKRAVYDTPENREIHDAWEVAEGEDAAHGTEFFVDLLSRKNLVIQRDPTRKIKWAVFEQDISMALRKQRELHVPLDCIELAEPITSFGRHTVPIRLDETTSADLCVEVQREVCKPMKASTKEKKDRMVVATQ